MDSDDNYFTDNEYQDLDVFNLSGSEKRALGLDVVFGQASSLKLQVEGAKKLSGLKPAIASLSIENSEAPEAIEVTML